MCDAAGARTRPTWGNHNQLGDTATHLEKFRAPKGARITRSRTMSPRRPDSVHFSQPLTLQRVFQAFHSKADVTHNLSEPRNEKPKVRRETKLLSTIVPFLPILATIVVTKNTDSMYADSVFITTYNDWVMPEKMTKDLYMLISMVFCWGCCVFGSITDPFYESD